MSPIKVNHLEQILKVNQMMRILKNGDGNQVENLFEYLRGVHKADPHGPHIRSKACWPVDGTNTLEHES